MNTKVDTGAKLILIKKGIYMWKPGRKKRAGGFWLGRNTSNEKHKQREKKLMSTEQND